MNKTVTSVDLPPEVIEAFTSSAVTAFQELAQLAAVPASGSADETALAHGTVLTQDTVVAVVQLLRSVPGQMTLILPSEAARRFAECYLPAGTELTDEIVNDGAGELANVIAGQAKTILKGTPYHFALSIPVVSRHEDCRETPGVAIRLDLEISPLVLLVDLSPTPGA